MKSNRKIVAGISDAITISPGVSVCEGGSGMDGGGGGGGQVHVRIAFKNGSQTPFPNEVVVTNSVQSKAPKRSTSIVSESHGDVILMAPRGNANVQTPMLIASTTNVETEQKSSLKNCHLQSNVKNAFENAIF